MDMAVLLTEAFTGCSTSCNTHVLTVILMSALMFCLPAEHAKHPLFGHLVTHVATSMQS